MIPMTLTFINIKGTTLEYICVMVVSGGATLFITKRTSPKGGVICPISMLRSIMAQNHMGSKFKALIMGMNMGMVIINIASEGSIHPMINPINIITITSPMGGKGRLTAHSTK